MRLTSKRTGIGWRRGCLLAAGVAALAAAALALVLFARMRQVGHAEGQPSAVLEPLGELAPAPPAEEAAVAAPAPAETEAEPEPEEPPPPAAAPAPPLPPPERVTEYAAARPKTVIELQPYRTSASIEAADAAGATGRATLINLQPRINRWYLLRLEWPERRATSELHLENRYPRQQVLALDPAFRFGPVIEAPDGRWACDLWSGDADDLAAAGSAIGPYVPLCERRLYLRKRVQGRKTAIEWTTDFLRDNVWQGEKITVFVRQSLYKDAYRMTSEEVSGGGPVAARRPRPPGAPARPAIDPAADGRYLTPTGLGLRLEAESPQRLLAGRWYPAAGIPGVFVSAFEPRLAAPEVVAAQRGLTNPLDEIESSALVYLVAFDLDRHEVGFSMGTDHPRVDWSERPPQSVRVASLPGPDGIGSLAPLVMTGMLSRDRAERAVATFTGGFKRSHGAFRSGQLSLINGGSHYGFVEAGVVLSKLQPGLATFVAWDDGTIDLRTWREADDGQLYRVVSARQNGLPLIEPDAESARPRVGSMVPRWAEGNWSGSVDKRLRSLRAGLCLQEENGDRFLLYGYFSTATPSAMARVFEAYRCRYAMLSDMNALEHTYLALYRRAGGELETEHLIGEMRVLDQADGGAVARRFLSFPDNRDFFHVTRREP